MRSELARASRLAAVRFQLWLVVRLSPRFRHRMKARKSLAERYLSGSGIEIGALHMPLRLPPHAHAVFVDRGTVVEQRRWFPELRLLSLVPVEIIDDAETLASIADTSQDFVIANHVIEHTQNPIATLGNWLRVVRPGGIIFFAVPDKRFTFDKARPLTTLKHLLRDWHEGPSVSLEEHLAEVARMVEGVREDEIADRVAEARNGDESPHFHVWTAATFRELLQHCRTSLHFPFAVEAIREVGNEFVVVLKRSASDLPRPPDSGFAAAESYPEGAPISTEAP